MNYKKIIFFLCILFFLSTERNAKAQSDTFHYVSDAIQTWVVPGCVTQVTVQLWAGGGGGGRDNNLCKQNAGGSGAYYEGVISGLIPGTILDLYVPSGGKYDDTLWGTGGEGGWPGGGKGGCSWDAPEYYFLQAGGGGGYAAIQINGAYYVVAGAGGGGGSESVGPYNTSFGGSGGATTGGNGGFGNYPTGGKGGTISAGGAPGYGSLSLDSGTSGKAFIGGHGGGYYPHSGGLGGGGGGAGYYGGGGGGDQANGGGGGSSYPASTFSSGGITFTPISNLQGDTGSNNVDYPAPGSPPASIGYGGYDTNGGNGLIIIIDGRLPLKSVISGETKPTCGFCNGSATVTASGGSSPYTYLWSPVLL